MKRNITVLLILAFVVMGIVVRGAQGSNAGHGTEGSAGKSHGSESADKSHGDTMKETEFKASKNEFSEEMVGSAPVEEVFPLLCPVREHDWIPTWKADMLWSESGLAEEGAVFKTGDETWIITEYEPMKRVNFVRYNPDVVTRLEIDVTEEHGKTRMRWTQSQVGTTEAGNSFVESRTSEGYSRMIKSAEVMLYYYLETGHMIDNETLQKHMEKSGH